MTNYKEKLKCTEGDWILPHFVQDEVNCNCRYVLCESIMGSIATIDYKTESTKRYQDATPEEAIHNAYLITNAKETYLALADLLEKMQPLIKLNLLAWELSLFKGLKESIKNAYEQLDKSLPPEKTNSVTKEGCNETKNA